MANAIDAANCWLKRQSRAEHPDGKFDNARRWYPSESEHQECCSYIRGPSRAYPYSYMTHCRSKEHVANLYGISMRLLTLALYLIKKESAQEIILRAIEITELCIGKPISNQRALTMAKRYQQAA